MDVVSGVSAVASLAILGAKLAVQVHTFVGQIRDADLNLQHIASDLESLVKVLRRLDEALKDPARRNVFNEMNGSRDFEFVLDELRSIFRRFETLMAKYNKIQHSALQKARWGWSGENDALSLGRTLVTHKQTLILTLQLTNTLALSSIGEGLDDRLQQTEGNTTQILLEMRELSRNTIRRDLEPDYPHAVEQWLSQAASYAGSTVGDNGPERVEPLGTVNNRTSGSHTSTRPVPIAYQEASSEPNDSGDDEPVASPISALSPPQPMGAKRTGRQNPSTESDSPIDTEVSEARVSDPSDKGGQRDRTEDSDEPGSKDLSEISESRGSVPTDKSRPRDCSATSDERGSKDLSEISESRVSDPSDERGPEDLSETASAAHASALLPAKFQLLGKPASRNGQGSSPQVLEGEYGIEAAFELANLLRDQGKRQEEDALLLGATQMFTRPPGSEDVRYLSQMHKLAIRLKERGKLQPALNLLTRTVAGYKSSRGADHKDTLVATVDLASIHQEMQHGSTAEALYHDAFEGFEKSFGPEYHRCLFCLVELGKIFIGGQRFNEAEEVLERALAMRQKTSGPKHRQTGRAIFFLGRAYLKQNKLDDFEQLYTLSLQAFDVSTGRDHRAALELMYELGMFYSEHDRLEEAEKLLVEAATGYERKCGFKNTDTAKCVWSLAFLYRRKKKYDKAEQLYARVVPELNNSIGPKHETTLRHMVKFAYFLKARNRVDEAIPLLERVLPEYESLFGKHHKNTREIGLELGGLYRKEGRHREAEHMLKRLMEPERRNTLATFPDVPRLEGDAQSDAPSELVESFRGENSGSESDSELKQPGQRKQPLRNLTQRPKAGSVTLATPANKSYSATTTASTSQTSKGKGKERGTAGDALERVQSESKLKKRRDESLTPGKNKSATTVPTRKGRARKTSPKTDHES